MCGIIGVFNFSSKPVSSDKLENANKCLQHRGPDSGDVAVIGHVGLGHRRLSIIDLSDEGNQPMYSEDGRYTIIFNGEVYNFETIKAELESVHQVTFKSHSDTEVVLKAFVQWGTDAIVKLNGMFAFAIFDEQKDTLVLARDRYGIKPLYYYKDDKQFVFSSEIEALKVYLSNDLGNQVDLQAVSEYMWYGNPLGANTFYKKINEVLPGRMFTITSGQDIEINRFWESSKIKENSNLNETEVVKRIRTLLDDSVKRHLISDVPVGIFLSGGVDSSVITALASKHYSGKINTYSVGFDFDKGVNELPKARQVAAKFNTEHHEVFVEGKDLAQVIEHLVDSHGEPFADAADIPLYLLTKKLKGEVKVVLQGDGGDELFGGYSRYFTLSHPQYFGVWKAISFLPWNRLEHTGIRQKVRFLDAINTNDEAERIALLLTMESHRMPPIRILGKKLQGTLRQYDPFKRYRELYEEFSEDDLVQKLFKTDISCILPDTFLEKVDKSTMANSIEVRVPFLDNVLVDYILSVPAKLKLKSGEKKYLLKKAFEDVVPADILYGPKTGFSVPYAFWIQKPLLSYMKSVLFDEYIISINLFDQTELQKTISAHEKGKGNFGFLLWKCLIMAIWVKKNRVVFN